MIDVELDLHALEICTLGLRAKEAKLNRFRALINTAIRSITSSRTTLIAFFIIVNIA